MVPIPGSELLVRIVDLAHGRNVDASSDGASAAGHHDAIIAKWFLGGRKLTYKFSARLDEGARQLRFRESATESSWGIPPPTLTVEKSSQHGAHVSTSRTDTGIGGGGTLDYGRLRDAVEQAVRAAGWQFTLETGKMP